MGTLSTVGSVTTSTGANNSATTTDNDLGPNAFLELLTTELQNQDPDSPQDATESVTQLAQMSELQYQQQLTSSFQAFQSNFGVLQAASLIGKAATVSTGTSSSSSSSSTVTGIIQSIDVQNGTPYFTMTNSSGQTITDNSGNPLLFSTNEILGIGSASSVTGSTSSSGT
ncbi:MAG TPA: flagellar hook capping FlgD N-terminal domain-containing protein [Candidatus Acidoferrales bacterium]|nr:flagellar hook capping FlgD N-terminal domain-containing protein [Candidatus Acidoferrales bacterium]